MKCPLCQSFKVEVGFIFQERRFLDCKNCHLTFVHREDCLNGEEEKKRYSLHDNSIRSEGYLNFLYRLIDIVSANIKDKDKKGLDYGSGPYPMLLELISEEGFKNCVGYDPFFNNNSEVWKNKYHFITICEVIEHVIEVKQTWEKLLDHLEPGGLIVMSTGIKPQQGLESWHYIIDPTHISFFAEKTFNYISQKYNLTFEILGKDLIGFWKK